jgi:hypothetical protein
MFCGILPLPCLPVPLDHWRACQEREAEPPREVSRMYRSSGVAAPEPHAVRSRVPCPPSVHDESKDAPPSGAQPRDENVVPEVGCASPV